MPRRLSEAMSISDRRSKSSYWQALTFLESSNCVAVQLLEALLFGIWWCHLHGLLGWYENELAYGQEVIALLIPFEDGCSFRAGDNVREVRIAECEK